MYLYREIFAKLCVITALVAAFCTLSATIVSEKFTLDHLYVKFM